ncbi:MAG: hypothetical protein M1404_04185 [Acidobacteria bacterium]|nr:hypothetical protein [Acidobacteriota bacterium]
MQIFGTAISSLHNKLVLKSSSLIDLSLRHIDRAEDIYSYAQETITLEIATMQEPGKVLLDRHQVHPPVRSGLIVLIGISKGEHIVRIRY